MLTCHFFFQMFKYCVLLTCLTCVQCGTVWLSQPGINAMGPQPRISGVLPYHVAHDPRFAWQGAQFNNFGPNSYFDGGSGPLGGPEMYFNEFGIHDAYHDYHYGSNDYRYSSHMNSIYPQQLRYTHINGGYNRNFVHPAMGIYPARGNCPPFRSFGPPNRRIGGINGIIQIPVFPTKAQVPGALPPPPKTVEPVKPVQHLKVEPLPKKPIETPVQWEGKS